MSATQNEDNQNVRYQTRNTEQRCLVCPKKICSDHLKHGPATFYGKSPHRLMEAHSLAARWFITSDILIDPIHFVVFIVQTEFANVAPAHMRPPGPRTGDPCSIGYVGRLITRRCLSCVVHDDFVYRNFESDSWRKYRSFLYLHFIDCSELMLISVTAMTKASDCGRSLPGIAGSNHAMGTDVCLW